MGVPRVLFRDEPAGFVEGLHEEELVRGYLIVKKKGGALFKVLHKVIKNFLPFMEPGISL